MEAVVDVDSGEGRGRLGIARRTGRSRWPVVSIALLVAVGLVMVAVRTIGDSADLTSAASTIATSTTATSTTSTATSTTTTSTTTTSTTTTTTTTTTSTTSTTTVAPPSTEARPLTGSEVFALNCADCHGPGGDGSSIGPVLIGNDLSVAAITIQLEFGSPNMPAWQDGLTPDERDAVIDYVISL